MEPLFSTAPGKWNWDGSDQKSLQGDKWRVKMEQGDRIQSPPFINLDLGIGGPSTDHHHRLKSKPCTAVRAVKVEEEDDGDDQYHDQMVEEEREKQRSRKLSVVYFTGEQLEELKTQLLIFKYMISGLPVPLQLLLPIWRCFSSSSSSSFTPLYFDLRRRNPCLIGLSNWGFNNRYSMDPEPGRCRRTDGKKWRCHQPVIPNEKYCERHMHRGSKRSRKLLEGSTQSTLNPGTLNLMSTSPKNNPSNDLKIKFPAILNQKHQFPDQKNPMITSYSSNVGACSEAKNGPTRVVLRVPSLTNTSMSNDHNKQYVVGKDNSIVKERIAAISLSSALDFSPKSVLQGGQKCPQVENPNSDSSSRAERCKRTDGKKWQCRKNVLPHQKYCAHHINRGTKRPSVTLSTSTEAEPLLGSAPNAKFSGTQQSQVSRHPNTGLNVSLTIGTGDPRQNTTDGDSGSTTETTITDESVDISDMIVMSP